MMFKQFLAAIVFAGALFAADAPLSFEVASVKPAAPQSGPGIRVMMSQDAGRVTMTGANLRMLLQRAYKIKTHQISGPDFLDTERFDIVAKIPEGVDKDKVPEMMQTLLAERFKLTLHKEQKVAPVYALVPGKNGPKLTPAEGQGGGMRTTMSPKGRKMTGEVQMAGLADMLSNMLDRPVLDQTEIKGVYKIDLEWSPDGSEMGGRMMMGGMRPPPPAGAGGPPEGEKHAAESSDAPTIFTAVQEQLGLRLEAKKSPIDIYVIDHAEKVPTEN